MFTINTKKTREMEVENQTDTTTTSGNVALEWTLVGKAHHSIFKEKRKEEKTQEKQMAPIFSAFQTTPYIRQNLEGDEPCVWKYLFVFGIKMEKAKEGLATIMEIEDYIDRNDLAQLHLHHIIADARGDGIVFQLQHTILTDQQQRTLRGPLEKARSGKMFRRTYPSTLLTEAEFQLIDRGGAKVGAVYGTGGQSSGEMSFRHQNLKLFLKSISNDADIVFLPFQMFLKNFGAKINTTKGTIKRAFPITASWIFTTDHSSGRLAEMLGTSERGGRFPKLIKAGSISYAIYDDISKMEFAFQHGETAIPAAMFTKKPTITLKGLKPNTTIPEVVTALEEVTGFSKSLIAGIFPGNFDNDSATFVITLFEPFQFPRSTPSVRRLTRGISAEMHYEDFTPAESYMSYLAEMLKIEARKQSGAFLRSAENSTGTSISSVTAWTPEQAGLNDKVQLLEQELTRMKQTLALVQKEATVNSTRHDSGLLEVKAAIVDIKTNQTQRDAKAESETNTLLTAIKRLEENMFIGFKALNLLPEIPAAAVESSQQDFKTPNTPITPKRQITNEAAQLNSTRTVADILSEEESIRNQQTGTPKRMKTEEVENATSEYLKHRTTSQDEAKLTNSSHKAANIIAEEQAENHQQLGINYGKENETEGVDSTHIKDDSEEEDSDDHCGLLILSGNSEAQEIDEPRSIHPNISIQLTSLIILNGTGTRQLSEEGQRGLFIKGKIPANTILAYTPKQAPIISPEEWSKEVAAGRDGYGFQQARGYVINCFNHREEAALANSPRDAYQWKDGNLVKAQANAKLIQGRGECYLRSTVNIDSSEPIEILYSYGNRRKFPTFPGRQISVYNVDDGTTSTDNSQRKFETSDAIQNLRIKAVNLSAQIMVGLSLEYLEKLTDIEDFARTCKDTFKFRLYYTGKPTEYHATTTGGWCGIHAAYLSWGHPKLTGRNKEIRTSLRDFMIRTEEMAREKCRLLFNDLEQRFADYYQGFAEEFEFLGDIPPSKWPPGFFIQCFSHDNTYFWIQDNLEGMLCTGKHVDTQAYFINDLLHILSSCQNSINILLAHSHFSIIHSPVVAPEELHHIWHSAPHMVRDILFPGAPMDVR